MTIPALTLFFRKCTAPYIQALCIFLFALPGLACHSRGSSTEPASTAPVKNPAIPYDLEAPSLQIFLSNDDLREISGLSPSNEPGQFLAIADERGEVFFVDAANGGRITRRVPFRDKGDFEGIEQVGNAIYALKSDGKVFEITHWMGDTIPVVKEYETALRKSDDLEGLGYDARQQALLLACKGNPENDSLRGIFAFDLKIKTLREKPLYTIDPKAIDQMVPRNEKEVEKGHSFSPSGVAVHPISGEIYVISSALKRLAVLDPASGALKAVVRLDKKILPQPEGISFDPQGNLYLSSEGKKGEGMLLRFDLKK